MKKLLLGLLFSFVIIASSSYDFISSRSDLLPPGPVKYLHHQQKRLLFKLGFGRKGRRADGRDTARNGGFPGRRRASLSKITALPYLQGYNPASGKKNVIHYDEQSAYDGLNLYITGHAPRAILMDMKGNVLHEWSMEFEAVWPGPLAFSENEIHKTFWRRAHLLENGDMLAIFEGLGLIKLDMHSNLLWSYKGRCHHDLFVTENGDIYVLTRRERAEYVGLDLSGPILEDYITVLNPRGEEIRSVSLIECFLNSAYASVLDNMAREGDVFHTNTLELLDGRLAGGAPMFKKGHALISIREIDTIAVVDLEKEEVTWALSGMWKAQHQPTLLANGNLLLFDNLHKKDKSKVIELNPLTGEIVWAYNADSKQEFFSMTCGSNQRLPNGNTLITESNNGRAFEVSPLNEIVWEFINPHKAGAENAYVACIFEMIRVEHDQVRFLSDSRRLLAISSPPDNDSFHF